MALTFAGFEASTGYAMGEDEWATYHHRAGVLAAPHGITSGFVASAAAGTRTVSVTAGQGIAPGILIDDTASATVTGFAANTGTSNRVDYLVLKVDWVAHTVTRAIVQGTSSAAPGLTQTPGVLWHVPLARVVVRPGVTTFAASDVIVCKPTPRKTLVFNGSNIAQTTLAHNSGGATLSAVDLPDPGWNFTLHIIGKLRVRSASGYALAKIRIGGADYSADYSDALTSAGSWRQLITEATSPPLSGQRTVDLRLVPEGLTAGDSLINGAGSANALTILQIPA